MTATSDCDGCCTNKCAFLGSGHDHHSPDEHDARTAPIPEQESK